MSNNIKTGSKFTTDRFGRLDVRRVGRGAMVGMLCLSGAVGLAALASVYRTSRGG
jgi:hypothetical protein